MQRDVCSSGNLFGRDCGDASLNQEFLSDIDQVPAHIGRPPLGACQGWGIHGVDFTTSHT
ncbi:protein of unknown function [Cupriavidus neocaledonicus]|uniref:Uncharacterized protein n=1 Tax=Cupriavidus neocaledonicus TaxID=1040979 RepID=A0A375H364_9BURK|nr:protein of unknown function [Cupriavidus neocaledonicus]